MSKALNPQNAPYTVNVEQGKTYYWCSCGRSKSQPYCDGLHKGTDFQPKSFSAEKTETIHLCGCKKTGTAPFCDGSHNQK
ncbi:MAG: CDGSH iron-sulfur domain-containing protein [Gammaproteobacteria bacterium]|nr:CDGSH iron-sulfur domain-containing protein [Gammaproteobacteria bacterium]